MRRIILFTLLLAAGCAHHSAPMPPSPTAFGVVQHAALRMTEDVAIVPPPAQFVILDWTYTGPGTNINLQTADTPFGPWMTTAIFLVGSTNYVFTNAIAQPSLFYRYVVDGN